MGGGYVTKQRQGTTILIAENFGYYSDSCFFFSFSLNWPQCHKYNTTQNSPCNKGNVAIILFQQGAPLERAQESRRLICPEMDQEKESHTERSICSPLFGKLGNCSFQFVAIYRHSPYERRVDSS